MPLQKKLFLRIFLEIGVLSQTKKNGIENLNRMKYSIDIIYNAF